MDEEVFISVTGNGLNASDLVELLDEAASINMAGSLRATTPHGTYVFKVVSAAVSVNGNVLLNLQEVK